MIDGDSSEKFVRPIASNFGDIYLLPLLTELADYMIASHS